MSAYVYLVLVLRSGEWRPFDWRNSPEAAAELVARLTAEGGVARVQRRRVPVPAEETTT